MLWGVLFRSVPKLNLINLSKLGDCWRKGAQNVKTTYFFVLPTLSAPNRYGTDLFGTAAPKRNTKIFIVQIPIAIRCFLLG